MAPESVQVWIPFLAITLGIGMIITLMVLLHRAKIRELDQRHRERMAAIEKGLDPYSLAGAEEADGPRAATLWRADRSPPRYLLRGLVWLGVGLAFVFSAGGSGAWAALPGWIAAAVGGAYVIYYIMEGRGRRSVPPPERPPGHDPGP